MEKYNNGETFEDRSRIYAEMDEILRSRGIDSKWFSVASDLMKFFADTAPDNRIIDFLNDFPSFSRELSAFLLSENARTFDLIMEGVIDKNGQELDYYLVEREQMFAETFIYMKYGSSQWERPDVGAWFAESRAYFNETYGVAIAHAAANSSDESFEYWDVNDRIALGFVLVDMKREQDNASH